MCNLLNISAVGAVAVLRSMVVKTNSKLISFNSILVSFKSVFVFRISSKDLQNQVLRHDKRAFKPVYSYKIRSIKENMTEEIKQKKH